MPKKERLWNRNFIISCVTYFLYACAFNLLMPTIPLYLSDVLGVTTSKIGIVLSSYAIALLFFRPFCGYLVDVYARKPLLLLGIILFVGAFFGYYFATTVLFFVVLRFVHGIFWGLSSVSANTVAIDTIPASRRAEGIGYFGVNMNLAMAIAPFIGVKIYDDYGFKMLVTSALLMGIASIFVIVFIHVPERKKLDHIPPLSLDRFILIKGLPIFGNQLFLSFGWGTLGAFAVLYGKEIGIVNAGMFFLFLAGGIVMSRVVAGKLIDQGYLHRLMAIAIILISIGYAGFALYQDVYFYCGSAFLIGLGYGTIFPALQTIYVNMAPASKRGTANSTYLTGFDLGIGIGMLAGGFLQGFLGYKNLFLFTALLSFTAFWIYIFNSRKVYDRNKLV